LVSGTAFAVSKPMSSKKDEELPHGFAGPGYSGFGGSAGYNGAGVGGVVGGYAGGGDPDTDWNPPAHTHHDHRINEDIRARLSVSSEVDSSQIEVLVEAGRVDLEGRVPTRHMKQLASDIAESVPGVLEVRNRLHVEHWFSAPEDIKARPA
jgi:hypothetical protein